MRRIPFEPDRRASSICSPLSTPTSASTESLIDARFRFYGVFGLEQCGRGYMHVGNHQL